MEKMKDYPKWRACADCKHFSGVVLEERKTLTSHGHASKRKKYLYECKACKSGHIPHWIICVNDLKIKHDHQCPFEQRSNERKEILCTNIM